MRCHRGRWWASPTYSSDQISWKGQRAGTARSLAPSETPVPFSGLKWRFQRILSKWSLSGPPCNNSQLSSASLCYTSWQASVAELSERPFESALGSCYCQFCYSLHWNLSHLKGSYWPLQDLNRHRVLHFLHYPVELCFEADCGCTRKDRQREAMADERSSNWAFQWHNRRPPPEMTDCAVFIVTSIFLTKWLTSVGKFAASTGSYLRSWRPFTLFCAGFDWN